jgi:hypothetical protein
MVADPSLDPVIVKEQLPVESVHFVALKETDPVPPCVQVTVPVGEGPEPLTVALQVVAEPMATEAGLHNRVRIDLERGPTVTVSPEEQAETAGELLSVTP